MEPCPASKSAFRQACKCGYAGLSEVSSMKLVWNLAQPQSVANKSALIIINERICSNISWNHDVTSSVIAGLIIILIILIIRTIWFIGAPSRRWAAYQPFVTAWWASSAPRNSVIVGFITITCSVIIVTRISIIITWVTWITSRLPVIIFFIITVIVTRIIVGCSISLCGPSDSSIVPSVIHWCWYYCINIKVIVCSSIASPESFCSFERARK